ncbi:hypothetical protein Tco_1173560 [Tanacetum coccineum]
MDLRKFVARGSVFQMGWPSIYRDKKMTVVGGGPGGLDELGEGSKEVVSKIGEFGGDILEIEEVRSNLVEEKVVKVEDYDIVSKFRREMAARPMKNRVKDAEKEGTGIFCVTPDGGPLLLWRKKCFEVERKDWNEKIHHHFHAWNHSRDEITMDDVEWRMRN